MAKELKAKSLASYGGHGIKTNKAVDLTLKFKYEELPNYIKLVQFLNENVTVKVKNIEEGSEVRTLGTFMVKEIKIDHDGEGQVKFNTMVDYAEVDELNTLVGVELFRVMFTATTEAADDDGDE